jgi:hypothetical protein
LETQIPQARGQVRRAANISQLIGPAATLPERRSAQARGTVSATLHLTGGCGGGWMRSILLWLIGVPIPIILLLAFCTHHF